MENRQRAVTVVLAKSGPAVAVAEQKKETVN